MGDTNTSEQVLASYVAKLGKRDGKIVQILTDKVINLNLRWRMFLYFFAGPKERLGVLNEASGLTAFVLQGLFWDDTLTRIRRLMDPAIDRKFENLSLEQLVKIARKNSVDLQAAYDTGRAACEPAGRHANKYIAHADLQHAMGDKASQVTRKDVTVAIEAIELFVQKFHRDVRGVTQGLRAEIPAGDHQQFLKRLYLGNADEKNRSVALDAGPASGDWSALEHTDYPRWIWDDYDNLALLNGR